MTSSIPTPGPYGKDPRLRDPSTYNRQECIDTIRALLHDLCAKVPFYDPAWILEPPPSGWPEITPKRLTPLGKTDEVVTLLAHLPYLELPGSNDERHSPSRRWPLIGESMRLYDFRSALYLHGMDAAAAATAARSASEDHEQADSYFQMDWGAPFITLPPWVVCLTNGGKYGHYVLLDTSDGTISWSSPFVGYYDIDYPEDDPRFWRGQCETRTMPVREYFQELVRDRIGDQECLPIWRHGEMQFVNAGHEVEEEAEVVKAIYREYGWPGELRREACREALVAHGSCRKT